MNPFKPTPSVREGIFSRSVWPEANVEIGKFRVMYGYRLRAGYIGEQWSEIDMCTGDNPTKFRELQSKVMTIMAHNGKDDPFKNIPSHSRRKPYWNDPEFVDRIDALYDAAVAAGQEPIVPEIDYVAEQFGEINPTLDVLELCESIKRLHRVGDKT